MIGYTLSLIRNSEGVTIGAAMFFKDLTRVEQLEERERLRDRLAALGEMAAAVAHEIKNPLAGIEVMAGLLRRQVRDNAQATALVGDIINEAKMANAIVQEILDFVRPVRLQMERTAVGPALQSAVTMADSKGKRGQVERAARRRRRPAADRRRPAPAVQVFTNLLINAYEALDGAGAVTVDRARGDARGGRRARRRTACTRCRRCVVEVTDDGPGVPPELADKIFSAVLHDQGPGLGPRAGHRAQDRRRARRADRPDQPAGRRHDVPGDAAGERRRAGVVGSGSNMSRILIADDHDALRRGLALALRTAGHEVEEAPNGNAAIERLHDGYFDVVVSDLRMGGSDGLDVLRTTRTTHPTSSVILMTAFGSVSTAVEAMKNGAFDYVQKPFEIEEMEVKIEKALELKRLRHELDYLRHEQQENYDFDKIIGASDALQRVLGVVRKVAKSNTTVLIRGETGTGKELIAGAIHHNSLRAGRNFVKVNCAALQENLLESELFGHEKGAFTGADRQRIGRFEQADGGTLFLDEIGDMSPSTQAKILRVLQEHEFERLGGTRTLKVDVRLIAATNRDLPAMVAAGHFREDLYYRLNVVTIEMPPLRERKEDILPLAMHFLRRFSQELKKKIDGVHARRRRRC